MRELKTQLLESKKVFDELAVLKKRYDAGKVPSGLSNDEKQTRLHRMDQLISKYRDIKAFYDNPAGGII